jgi:LysM repeat protein
MTMKKIVAFFCCSLLMSFAFGQNDKVQRYIDAYKDIAIAEMIRTGVPASIILAQGILESGCGESDLCKKSNNHFGIKCKDDWAGEKVYHDDDTKGECFRVYASAAESYKDHSDFLKNRPYYAELFKLDPIDYEGWAKGLKKAGYATERDYPQRLIKLINDNNLQQFTLLALQKKQDNNADVTAATTAQAPQITEIKATPELEEAADMSETVISPAHRQNEKIIQEKKYSDTVFTINHTRVIYAREGTSLLSLANKYGITLSKLLDYNDFDEMDVLDKNRLVFIEKKMKKGASDFHVVEEGETLHEICQTEGVRMESVLEYNKMKKGMRPAKGEKIYLRSQAPTSPKSSGNAVASNS